MNCQLNRNLRTGKQDCLQFQIPQKIDVFHRQQKTSLLPSQVQIEQKQNKKDEESSEEEDQQGLKGYKAQTLQFLTQKALLDQYLSIIFGIDPNSPQDPYKYSEKLHEHHEQLCKIETRILQGGLFEKCSQFAPEIIIHSVKPTKYCEIVIVQVHLGFYITKITILNIPSAAQNSPLHSCAQITAFGAFGNIYLIQNQIQLYAVKCIVRESSSNFINNLRNLNIQRNKILIDTIREYFFLRLFSELQIGPKAKQFLGFDLVVFNDCIQYSMQICTPFQMNEKNQKQLKQNLKKMHLMRIAHRDIKSDNMMFSKEFNKPVFIDFGGCTFVNQAIGQRSMTKFIGTTGFYSSQMIKIYNQNQGLVDLYYNDLYGLKRSIFDIQAFQSNQFGTRLFQIKHQETQSNVVKNSLFLLCLMKFQLFNNRFDQYKDLVMIMERRHPQQLQVIEFKFLKFLIDLKPHRQLGRLYRSYSAQMRSLKQFEYLKDVYRNQLSEIVYIWLNSPTKQNQFFQTSLLYQNMGIQYGNLDVNQKNIQLTLMSKQSVQNYLMNQNIKQRLNTQKLIMYCLVAIHYCAIANNRYKVSMQEKIKVSRFVLQALKNNQYTSSSKYLELIFECPFKKLETIAIIFQFFVFQIWSKIPQKYGQICIKYSISSLSLLGYPFYLKDAKLAFLYQFFKQVQISLPYDDKQRTISQKIKLIIRFWRIFALILSDNYTFYSRRKQNFMMQTQDLQQIKQGYAKFQQQVMLPQENALNQFLTLNHYFYQLIVNFTSDNYEETQIYHLISVLQHQSRTNKFKKGRFDYSNEWKHYIYLIMYLTNQPAIQKNMTHPNKILNKIMINYSRVPDIQLHLGSYLMSIKNVYNLDKVQRILKVIDAIISNKEISQRYFLDYRIFIAWKLVDANQIQRISYVVYQQTQHMSVYNFQNILNILIILHPIMLSQRLNWWSNVMLKLSCLDHLQKMFQRAKQYISHFLSIKKLNLTKKPKNMQITQRQLQKSIENIPQIQIQIQRQQMKIFKLLKQTINLMTIVWLYSQIYMKTSQSKYKFIKHNVNQSIVYQNIDPVKYLRENYKIVQSGSLFLCEQRQREVHSFLQEAIRQLFCKDQNTPKDQLNQDDFNQKISILLSIVDMHDHASVISIIDKQIKQPLTIDKLMTNKLQTMPSIRISTIYFISKLVVNNYKLTDDYQNLITFYENFQIETNDFYLFFQTNLIRHVFNGYIYCKGSNQKIFMFLLRITNLLKNYQYEYAIQFLHKSLQSRFQFMSSSSPQWKKTFPIFSTGWKPLQFIDYLSCRVHQLDEVSHSYMSLVYYYALSNVYISIDKKRRFFVFIIKSIKHLKPIAKKIIFQKLYAHAFDLKAAAKGIYTPGLQTHDYREIKPYKQVKFDRKMADLQFYYAYKFLNNQASIDIGQLIKSRFELKKIRKKKWSIPKHIQKIYRKKLHRYHYISGGFNEHNNQATHTKNLIINQKDTPHQQLRCFLV